MPIFIAQGRYSNEAVRAMTESPEDRTEAVARLIESLGGKLLGWYLTTGEYDWLTIVEAKSEEDMLAAAIVAAGGGATGIRTSAAYPGPQAKAIFEKARGAAAGYQAPGRPRPSGNHKARRAAA